MLYRDLLECDGTFLIMTMLPITFFFVTIRDRLIEAFLLLWHLSWLLFYFLPPIVLSIIFR